MLAWFDTGRHDVLLTPAVAGPPVKAGAMRHRGYLSTTLLSASRVPYTQAWNLAGLPAVVVPVRVSGRAVAVFTGGSLLFGLLRDDRRFRIAGLALLAAAIAKVFLFDLSTLESIYRVLSFIALGLLLLAAAFAYQRIRARIVEEAP